jgi:hypothetical protein
MLIVTLGLDSVLRAQKRHQSGVRKSPAGRNIIRGQATNKSATLLPVRKGILSARRTRVKANLLIARCGRPAAMNDYHARNKSACTTKKLLGRRRSPARRGQHPRRVRVDPLSDSMHQLRLKSAF